MAGFKYIYSLLTWLCSFWSYHC